MNCRLPGRGKRERESVGRAGLEPATKCLKGACSTIELTTRFDEPSILAHAWGLDKRFVHGSEWDVFTRIPSHFSTLSRRRSLSLVPSFPRCTHSHPIGHRAPLMLFVPVGTKDAEIKSTGFLWDGTCTKAQDSRPVQRCNYARNPWDDELPGAVGQPGIFKLDWLEIDIPLL